MGDTTNDEAANYGKRPRVIETLDKLTRQYEDAKYGEGFVRTLVDSLKVTDEQCMEYFTNEMEKKYGKEGEQPKQGTDGVIDLGGLSKYAQPESLTNFPNVNADMRKEEQQILGRVFEQPKREPMLSDDVMEQSRCGDTIIGAAMTAQEVRAYYESLIDKGVLISSAPPPHSYACMTCDRAFSSHIKWSYCPVCGDKF